MNLVPFGLECLGLQGLAANSFATSGCLRAAKALKARGFESGF